MNDPSYIHRILENYRHPLRSPELRALRQLQRDYPDTPYVFVSERKAPLSTRSVRHVIARAGKLAGLPGRVHPHQLRHACGYYLATNGQDTRAIQDYLGHRNIQHTVRYTQLNPSQSQDRRRHSHRTPDEKQPYPQSQPIPPFGFPNRPPT